jgi:syndecan 4
MLSLAGCLTVDGPYVGVSCVLPFTYNGKTYGNCTTVDNGYNNGSAWCATGSNAATKWGICDDYRLCSGGN